MVKLIVFLFLLEYSIFFIVDKKKALLTLFFLKLPLDQITWNIPVSIGAVSLRASEVLVVFATLLCVVTFLVDRVVQPSTIGVRARILNSSNSVRRSRPYRHRTSLLGYSQGLSDPIWSDSSLPTVIKAPVLIFTVVYFIQIFREPSIIRGLRPFFQMTTGIFLGIVVADTFRTADDVNWLIRSMLFGTAIMAVLNIPAVYSGGALQIYTSAEDPTIGTYLAGGVGRYYAADSFANALLVNVPVVLLASIVLKSGWEKTLCFFVMLFVVMGVFASCIRAAWLGLALLLGTWMVAQKRWNLLIISVICLIIMITSQTFSNPLQKAYQKISFEVESLRKYELPDQAFGGRPGIWKGYAGYYMNLPILTRIAGSNEYLGLNLGHDPHNDFLHILLGMGVIGLCVTLYLYVKTGVNLFEAWREIKTLYNRNVALTALLALLNMLIPSLTRTGLMNPNYQWAFWSFTMLTLRVSNAPWNVSHEFESTQKAKRSTRGGYRQDE